jgi:hypothetical protein
VWPVMSQNFWDLERKLSKLYCDYVFSAESSNSFLLMVNFEEKLQHLELDILKRGEDPQWQ